MLCIVGVVGGGSGHVLGGSPVLCADPRGVYDGSDDAYHAAHAASAVSSTMSGRTEPISARRRCSTGAPRSLRYRLFSQNVFEDISPFCGESNSTVSKRMRVHFALFSRAVINSIAL